MGGGSWLALAGGGGRRGEVVSLLGWDIGDQRQVDPRYPSPPPEDLPATPRLPPVLREGVK